MLAFRAKWIGARNGWNALPHLMDTANLCKGVMVFVKNQLAVVIAQSLLARLKIENKGFVLFIGYWHKAHSPLWKLRWVIFVRKVRLHLLGLHVKHLNLGFGLN